MNTSALFSILEKVLTNPKVIITTVIIFLYFDIVCAIIRYRKKAKPIKKKAFVPPTPKQEENNESNENNEEGDE